MQLDREQTEKMNQWQTACDKSPSDFSCSDYNVRHLSHIIMADIGKSHYNVKH